MLTARGRGRYSASRPRGGRAGTNRPVACGQSPTCCAAERLAESTGAFMHRRRLTSIAIALTALLATTGCGHDDSPGGHVVTSQHAISGGYVSSQDTAVVGIVSFSGGLGICSGSLIMPNLVLTARHCVAPVRNEVNGGVDCDLTYFGSNYSPGQLYVTTTTTLQQGGQYYHAAREIITPTSTAFCGNDVAMVVLDEPIYGDEATPLVPRVDSAIVVNAPFSAPGEEYYAVGYGVTADDKDDSGARRRRDDLNATCVESQCPTYFGMTDTEWLGDTGICSGDSGGPAIDLQDRVIGVVSRGGMNCSTPIYGSVHAWGDWIKETALHAAQLGGTTPPNWALGWPTDASYYAEIGMSCGSNGDCGGGLCIEGVCTRPCTELATCPTGYGCNGGRCALLPVGALCEDGSSCASGDCRDGVCTRPCDAATPCPSGYTCDGTCHLLPVGQACAAPTDCESGNCLDGRCTRACGAEAPCPAAFTCDAGAQACMLLGVGDMCGVDGDCRSGLCQDASYCTRYCASQAECPNGYACDTAVNRCLEIPVGGACAGLEGECGAGVCGADATCTRGCDDLAPCPTSYTCDQGLCAQIDVGAQCVDAAECSGGLCVGGACTRTCDAEYTCPDGYHCGGDGVCAKSTSGG
ncbi:MAG: trypsin-like serine protease, partial [Deltaproteobacteria bacterium]